MTDGVQLYRYGSMGEQKDIIRGGGLLKNKNSLALRFRIILLGIVFMLAAASVVSIFYFIQRERKENAVREADNIMLGLSDSIYSDITRYKELSRLVMVDDRLVTFLRADSETVDQGLMNDARYGVLDIINVTTMIDSVFVFRDDGLYIATNRGKFRFDYKRMIIILV